MIYKIITFLSFLICGQALASLDDSNRNTQNLCDLQDDHARDNKAKNEISEWANNLPILKDQDDRNINHMKYLVAENEKNPKLSEDDFIDHFQRILALPLQTVCHVGKWVALNRWNKKGGSTDGERYLCMDNFFEDIRKDKCIIYSFGISDNYVFEAEMGSIGCTVHAYDPTVDLPSSPAKNVFFHKMGLSHFKGNMEMRANHLGNHLTEPLPVTTLNDVINSNGHLEKEITYLKVDIESSEIKAIPQWIQSGVLQNVRQIGLELHTGKTFFDRSGQANAAKSLLKSIAQLYELGFRHISYAPNLFVDKRQDHKMTYYTYIDVVLYKPYTSKEGA